MPEVGEEAALYVDPHNPADLAQQVAKAVEDSAMRERCVEQGLRRVKNFTWRRTAEETLAVYDEILERIGDGESVETARGLGGAPDHGVGFY